MEVLFRKNYRYKLGAFSLIEVTVAIAITAISMLSLLTLIPQGLNQFKDSRDKTVKTIIFSKLSNRLQSMSSDIKKNFKSNAISENFFSKEYYCDFEGHILDDNKKLSSNHVYSAIVEIPNKNIFLADGLRNEDANSNLYLAKIKISSSPIDNWNNTILNDQVSNYYIYLTNMGLYEDIDE